MENKIKFSLDFQRHVLASLLTDKESLGAYVDTIDPTFFTDEILRGVAAASIQFYRGTSEVPTEAALSLEIKANIAPGRQFTEYEDEIREVFSKRGQNTSYYLGKASEYTRIRAVANAIQDSVPLLELGEVEEIGRRISGALVQGVSSGLDSYDYLAEAKDRVLRYVDGQSGADRTRVPTGFQPMDDAIGGGLGRGELGVIVALPKHGKTTALVNMGAHSLLQNRNVLHFTLELSKHMIATKYDTCLFQDTLLNIKSKPKKFAQSLLELKNRITGRLVISEFPTKTLTLEKMGAVIRRVGNVGLVLVDYGQLLKSNRIRTEIYHELTDIYEGLRRVAGEFQVPIWTAHQANRPGTGSKVIRIEHIAGDFNVAAIADVTVSVNQTEEEMLRNQLRLYIMGSRVGPSGEAIACNVNWKTGNINAVSEENDNLG